MIDTNDGLGYDGKERVYRVSGPYYIVELVFQRELGNEGKLDFSNLLQETARKINERFNIEINGFCEEERKIEQFRCLIYLHPSSEKSNPIIVTARHYFILCCIKEKIPKSEIENFFQAINGSHFPASSSEVSPENIDNFLDKHFPLNLNPDDIEE